MGKKTGLKIKEIDSSHWTIKKQSPPSSSHLTLRIIDGTSLLASDVITGKSDPVCFVYLSYPGSEEPNLDNAVQQQSCVTPKTDLTENKECFPLNDNEETEKENNLVTRVEKEEIPVVMTKVCATTTDPIWNEDIYFPIEITTIKDLIDLKISIVVKDQDEEEGQPGVYTYDDLGCAEISVSEIFQNGRVLYGKNTIIEQNKRLVLHRTKNMRRVDGSIKVNISLTLYDDGKVLYPEIFNHYVSLNQNLSSIDFKKSISIEKFVDIYYKINKVGGVDNFSLKEMEKILIPLLVHSNNSLTPNTLMSAHSTTLKKNSSKASITPRYAPMMSARRSGSGLIDTSIEIYPSKNVPILKLPEGTIKENNGFDWEDDGIPRHSTNNDKENDMNINKVEDEFQLPMGDQCAPPPLDDSSPNPENVPEQVVAQGNAISGIRALKANNNDDVNNLIQKGLQELIAVTKDGLNTINKRFDKIDIMVDTNANNNTISSNNDGNVEAVIDTSTKLIARNKPSKKDNRVDVKALKKSHAKQKKKELSDKGVIDGMIFAAEPDVELIHKDSSGSVVSSKILPSVSDSIDIPIQYPTQNNKYKHNSNHNTGNNNHNNNNYNNNNNNSPIRMYKGTDWGLVDAMIGRNDYVSAFVEVLDRGNLDDLAKILELIGPHPEYLSVSIRNRTYDGIATLLSQASAGNNPIKNSNNIPPIYIERCLVWILALLRGKDKLSSMVVGHTKRDLEDALDRLKDEQSKRGMLAGLLINQLRK